MFFFHHENYIFRWISVASGSVTALATGAASNVLRVGGNATEYLNGLLAEVLVWNKALTDDERTQLYDYIEWKWGLTI